MLFAIIILLLASYKIVLFRRENDKKRHKCLEERLKPICDQHGAVQCPKCEKWFKSKGDMAVHRCIQIPSLLNNAFFLMGKRDHDTAVSQQEQEQVCVCVEAFEEYTTFLLLISCHCRYTYK